MEQSCSVKVDKNNILLCGVFCCRRNFWEKVHFAAQQEMALIHLGELLINTND